MIVTDAECNNLESIFKEGIVKSCIIDGKEREVSREG